MSNKKKYKVKYSQGGAKGHGQTSAPWDELVGEVIDNSIPAEKPEIPVTIRVNLNFDKNNLGTLIFADNYRGIPREDMPHIFDLRFSGSSRGKYSRQGMGLKIAQPALGELAWIISKTKDDSRIWKLSWIYSDGEDDCEVEIEEYNGNEWDKAFPSGCESGTIVKIINSKKVRYWSKKQDFKNWCAKFEASYATDLVKGFCEIFFTYTKSSKTKNGKINSTIWTHVAEPYEPLLTHRIEMLDADLLLGKNKPELDRVPVDLSDYDYPEMKLSLTCGYKPTLDQVTKWYIITGDETYNPNRYEMSPYGYGTKKGGINLSLDGGKTFSFNLKPKSSRESAHYIRIDVEESDRDFFSALKSGTPDDQRFEDILAAVDKQLNDIHFYTRSRSGIPSTPENEHIERFEYLCDTDPEFQKLYGIIDPAKQVFREVPTKLNGRVDLLILDFKDPTLKTYVLEGKKDTGNAQDARQLADYMICCRRTPEQIARGHSILPKGLFLSPVLSPTFIEAINMYTEFYGTNFDIVTDYNSIFDIDFIKTTQLYFSLGLSLPAASPKIKIKV